MKRRIAIAVGLLTIVAGASAGTYAWGSSTDATQTINACVGPAGVVRIVDAGVTCRTTETAASWNTVGPQGPGGPAGAQGPAGPQGPAGVAANPDAVTATLSVTGHRQGVFSTTPIAITGVTHGVISPRDPASGLPTGKRQHKPLTITKQLDKTSPLFLSALVSNENLTQVLLTVQVGGQNAYTIKLTNAFVSDDELHGSTESISFTYQQITWTWLDGGITASDDLTPES